MTRIVMKKTALLFFVVIAFFFGIHYIGFSDVRGYNYETTSSWKGHDLGFDPQGPIPYESDYVSFLDIIDNHLAASTDKIYVINDAFELYKLSELSNGEHRTTYLGLHYVLGKDIDYYDIVQININYRFVPIGFIEPFVGTFDGQGYEITNLFFQSIFSEEDYDLNYFGLRYISMFSRVGLNGHIRNLGLVNPIVLQPIEWGLMEHVSALVGENQGTIEHVYLRDTRGLAAGFSAEGYFRIAGLVSINSGSLSNAYVAAPLIKSSAVFNNLSTSAVVYSSSGVLNNVYYDESILIDDDIITTHGTGLLTADFQNELYFGEGWFLNDAYHDLTSIPGELAQVTLNNTYPILKGLTVEDGILHIRSAVDFAYMNTLLLTSGFFRSSHYQVVADIDMNQVSIGVYAPVSIAFNGTLSSALSTEASRLYERQSSQGGDPLYHTIIGLNISQAASIGNYASYALFGALFGTIENLNFVDFTLWTDNIDQHVNRSKIVVGMLAGQMNNGRIENVHVHGTIDLHASTSAAGRILVGGLVAEGSGQLIRVSTNGTISHDAWLHDVRSDGSATGGLVGLSHGVMFDHAINGMAITGMSYQSLQASTLYLGGVVGHGRINGMTKVVNAKTIVSHDEDGFVHTLYVGGIIGRENQQSAEAFQVFNDGNIDVLLTNPMTLMMAGYGHIDMSGVTNNDITYTYTSLTNDGRLRLVHINGNTFSQAELEAMDIQIAGVVSTDGIDGTFYGLFNERDIDLDLSVVSRYAGIIDVRNSTHTTIVQSYQTGMINAVTQNMLVHGEIKIAGVLLGDHVDLDHARNEGAISITFNHNTVIASGRLMVTGVMETVSDGREARNLFNGGDLSVLMHNASTINYDLHVAGIAYKNENTSLYAAKGVSTTSIDFFPVEGSLHNVVNDGDLTITGAFNGSSMAAGIVLMNAGMTTTAINLGAIDNKNDIQVAGGSVESGGISYLMIGQHAQIRDAANYGRIEAVSTTNNGYAHASGLAVRNDRLENGTMVSAGNLHYRGMILFSINYGDIHAWNQTVETGYGIINETRTKASGVLAQGLLTIINILNYGNIHSRYLAGGMIAFVDLPKFGNIPLESVYLANFINYGKIRAITGYDPISEDYTINMTSNPTRQPFNGYGGVFGKIHTGTTMWSFLSVDPASQYPIDQIFFGYLFNLDSVVNMFDNGPEVTIDDNLAKDAIGNDILMNIINRMTTTRPTDNSRVPFNETYLGNWPQGSTYGRRITSREFNDTLNGIFSSESVLRKAPLSATGTDRYLREYIQYIPREGASDVLLAHLEADTSDEYTGLFALSSSKGIGNGIFIPDHLELDNLHPYILGSGFDDDWLGDPQDSNSVIYKLTMGMRQIKVAFATSIYNAHIIQVDENGDPIEDGLVLNNPEIDQDRGLITYYLPSNAAILSHQVLQNRNAYGFIEASENLGSKVPDKKENDIWTYKWVGDYRKDGFEYIEIGPYHTDGVRNVTFSTSMVESKGGINDNNISVPVYNRDAMAGDATIGFVHEHLPHVKYDVGRNFRWEQTGYQVNSTSTVSAGYGAYRTFTFPTPPPNYTTLYEYVGPSQYAVTYVSTDATANVPFYDDAGVYFKLDTSAGSYQIAESASFEFEGQSLLELITIPLGYGAYDVWYDADTDEYIDSIEAHYGKVRVYSASYVAGDPSTYRDYDVRILRTQNQTLSALDQLLIDGLNARPGVISDLNHVTATRDIHYMHDGDLGTMRLTYTVENYETNHDFIPYVSLYDNHTDVKIHTANYLVVDGKVFNTNSYNNLTGALGTGEVTLDFTVTEILPSGSYRLEIELVSGEIYAIYFDKILSANANVIDFIHAGRLITPTDDMYVSEVPFGMFHDETDAGTKQVNFSNLESLTNVFFDDLDGANLPSHLEGMTISPYATLLEITLDIALYDAHRYRYTVTYTIEAEDGTLNTFTHELIEAELTADFLVLYKDGGEMLTDGTPITIRYIESPTIRGEYDFDSTYFPNADVLDVDISFVPLIPEEEAFINQDYFISILVGHGYELDFSRMTPMGTYTVTTHYVSTVELYGVILSWTYELQSTTLIKVQNDDSLLNSIAFVSDTVFSGFDTIIDIEVITPEAYIDYLLYPETRKINLLPSRGIAYLDYDEEPIYWIIGQVQRTNLTVYEPVFYLPDGAIIRRVTDQVNIGYEFQSETLMSDFSPLDFGFNFVQYRVYAQDFDENPDHYTDYFIAVQDVTNNIRLNLTIINDTDLYLDKVFVRVNVCQIEDDYSEECPYDDIKISMSIFSYYNEATGTFTNNQFVTSMYGTYQIFVDLPLGYEIEVKVQTVLIDGKAFFLEDSIIPRRYFVTVTIKEVGHVSDWGYNITEEYLPETPALDPLKTYEAAEMFAHDGIEWIVQPGYTYTYDPLLPPGHPDVNGIMDASGVWGASSTYLAGDIVTHDGFVYQAQLVNKGLDPDLNNGPGEAWLLIEN